MADEDEEASGISVSVRIRPLNQRELKENQTIGWEFNNTALIEQNAHGTKTFTFDHVFAPDTTNNTLVYECVARQVVQKAMLGYNGTVFTYGQTGSGKTWSIMGSKEDPGITIRCISDIFAHIRANPHIEFSLRVSYLEVYNEEINDLLQGDEGRNLRIVSDDPIKGPVIGGLTEEEVKCEGDIMGVIERGEQNRSYGSTQMNDNSSRSHTLYRLIIESKEEVEIGGGEGAEDSGGFRSMGSQSLSNTKPVVKLSYLNLVDLAGSERQKSTGAKGKQLKEGANINKSLLALGSVIQKLVEQSKQGERGSSGGSRKAGFIPYRDSKLTRILKQSLGGNALTSILCTITAAPMHHEETVSTLKFGQLCKTIKNKPKSNTSVDDKVLLRQSRDKIAALRDELETKTAQLKAELAKSSDLTTRLAEAKAEAARIAQATKVDDATAALLEQTRLSATREKTRADDLESKIDSLKEEAMHQAEAECERKLQAEKRKYQRDLQQIQEQTARAEELDERESDLDEEKHRLQAKERELELRSKQQQEEQAALSRLFVRLDESESDLHQQLYSLKKQYDEWEAIRSELARKEVELKNWQTEAVSREESLKTREASIGEEETRLKELDKELHRRDEECNGRDAECDRRVEDLKKQSKLLEEKAADITRREAQTNNWNGLLLTREQDVEAREGELRDREVTLEEDRNKNETLKLEVDALQSTAKEKAAELTEKEKYVETTTRKIENMKEEYEEKLRSLGDREQRLTEAEAQNKALSEDLAKRESSLAEQQKNVEERESKANEREQNVQELEKRYFKVVESEAQLTERVSKQKKKEEAFYKIEAQVINNKNAQELRAMEAQLEEQSLLVKSLQSDKLRLLQERDEKADTLTQVQSELDREKYAHEQASDLMGLINGTRTSLEAGGGDSPELRDQLYRSLSHTESILRYTLLLNGRKPATTPAAHRPSPSAANPYPHVPAPQTPGKFEDKESTAPAGQAAWPHVAAYLGPTALPGASDELAQDCSLLLECLSTSGKVHARLKVPKQRLVEGMLRIRAIADRMAHAGLKRPKDENGTIVLRDSELRSVIADRDRTSRSPRRTALSSSLSPDPKGTPGDTGKRRMSTTSGARLRSPYDVEKQKESLVHPATVAKAAVKFLKATSKQRNLVEGEASGADRDRSSLPQRGTGRKQNEEQRPMHGPARHQSTSESLGVRARSSKPVAVDSGTGAGASRPLRSSEPGVLTATIDLSSAASRKRSHRRKEGPEWVK